MLSSIFIPLYVFLSLFRVITAVMAQRQSLPARVLIYSATAGFRHDSIPTAIAALKAKGPSINVQFDATEDRTQFTDTMLAGYDALLFLSATGEILDDAGKAAFQKYLNLGGNFIGIHSSSDCLVNTTFYGREVGTFFDYHADLQNAIVDVIDASHPSTSMLPAEWHVRDEMYNFKSDPRALGATVVLAANESSYIDKGTRKFDQGTPHPLAWFQAQGSGVDDGNKSSAGRSFYTSLGHLNETWQDVLFISHVLGGVSWALQSNTTRAMNSSALVGNTPGQSSRPQASGSSTNSGAAPANATQSSSTALTTITITAVTIIAVVVGYGYVLFFSSS